MQVLRLYRDDFISGSNSFYDVSFKVLRLVIASSSSLFAINLSLLSGLLLDGELIFSLVSLSNVPTYLLFALT